MEAGSPVLSPLFSKTQTHKKIEKAVARAKAVQERDTNKTDWANKTGDHSISG